MRNHHKKLACLAVATTLGAALIAAPAQARGGWSSGRSLGPLLGFGLGLGTLSAAADSTCWTWVQTPFGWQRVWAVSHCNLGYGGNFHGPGW